MYVNLSEHECWERVQTVRSRLVYFRLRQTSSDRARSRRLETSASLHLKTRASLINWKWNQSSMEDTTYGKCLNFPGSLSVLEIYLPLYILLFVIFNKLFNFWKGGLLLVFMFCVHRSNPGYHNRCNSPGGSSYPLPKRPHKTEYQNLDSHEMKINF